MTDTFERRKLKFCQAHEDCKQDLALARNCYLSTRRGGLTKQGVRNLDVPKTVRYLEYNLRNCDHARMQHSPCSSCAARGSGASCKIFKCRCGFTWDSGEDVYG